MRAKIVLILISNIVLLTFADILKFFNCKKLVRIILNQAKINLAYCEEYAKEVNK